MEQFFLIRQLVLKYGSKMVVVLLLESFRRVHLQLIWKIPSIFFGRVKIAQFRTYIYLPTNCNVSMPGYRVVIFYTAINFTVSQQFSLHTPFFKANVCFGNVGLAEGSLQATFIAAADGNSLKNLYPNICTFEIKRQGWQFLPYYQNIFFLNLQ